VPGHSKLYSGKDRNAFFKASPQPEDIALK
jgi:hypothetical protein